MLVAIREKFSGVAVKAIFIVIVLSFVLWGIGDIFRGGGGRHDVAKVGDMTIPRGTYERNVQQQVRQYQQYMGDRFGDAMRQTIETQVLQSMVNDALLELETKRMGLLISDKAVANAIQQNPEFFGDAGGFDKDRFKATLRNNNISERDYADSIRRNIAGSMLLGTLTMGRTPPEVLVDATYRFGHERRTADVLRLPFDANAPVADPDEKALEEFFAKVSPQFQVPEYRTASYLLLGLESVLKNIHVDDAALHQAFEESAGDYATPEERTVEQLVIPTKEDADKVLGALNAGKAPKDIAKDFPEVKDGFTSLGEVQKNGLPAATADAVFALEKDKYSAPVKTDFGYGIFRVTKIVAGKAPSFDEVKEKLREHLTQKQAEEALYALTTQVDDALGGGATLEEIAKEFNLPVGQVGPVSNAGKDPAGKDAVGMPPFTTFMRLMFSTDQGDVSQLTEAEDNRYFVLRVDNVSPSRQQKLEEVRAQVVKLWKDEQRHEALAKRADALAEEARQGASLEALAKTNGLKLTQVAAFGRDGKGADGKKELIAPRFAGMLFQLTKGEPSEPYVDADGSYAIGAVREIVATDGAKDDKALAEAKDALAQSYYYELMAQYVDYLRAKYPVELYYTPAPATQQ